MDEDEATCRLETPISVDSLISEGTAEFAIKSEDIIEGEEDTLMEKTYSPEKLECFSSAYLNEPYEDDTEEAESDNADENVFTEFANFRKRMTNVRDDGKLMKMIERTGTGGLIPDDDSVWTVYAHYAGYIELADYTFDASRLRHKKPARLRLDELFPGFCQALRTMRKGEKAKFLIHPDLAFGEAGVPPRIPGNETLLYEIELFDFALEEHLHPDDIPPPDSYLDKIEKARKCRERGNKRKKIGKDVNGAICQYRRGITILMQTNMANEEEEAEIRRELVKLYANLAVSYLNKKDYRRVCNAYKDAVHDCQELASNHVKLNYVSAKALRFLGDFNEAKNRIRRANRLKPGDSDILNELNELEEAIRKHKLEETRSARRMFGFAREAPKDEENIDDVSNELDQEFKTAFDSFLNDFINDSERRMQQLPGCSLAERTYCQRMCRSKNISVKEVGTVGEKQLIFTKLSMSM